MFNRGVLDSSLSSLPSSLCTLNWGSCFQTSVFSEVSLKCISSSDLFSETQIYKANISRNKHMILQSKSESLPVVPYFTEFQQSWVQFQTWKLWACSNFISVAVINYLSRKQLERGKGLFALQFQGMVHDFWEVQAASYPQSKTENKHMDPGLLACLLTLSSLSPLCTAWDLLLRDSAAKVGWVFPHQPTVRVTPYQHALAHSRAGRHFTETLPWWFLDMSSC